MALNLTCGRRQVMSPCSPAMGVELSQNRDLSSEGKSGSSNRGWAPHSALPSSFIAPATFQPGSSYRLCQQLNLSQLWPSSLPPCTFHLRTKETLALHIHESLYICAKMKKFNLLICDYTVTCFLPLFYFLSWIFGQLCCMHVIYDAI